MLASYATFARGLFTGHDFYIEEFKEVSKFRLHENKYVRSIDRSYTLVFNKEQDDAPLIDILSEHLRDYWVFFRDINDTRSIKVIIYINSTEERITLNITNSNKKEKIFNSEIYKNSIDIDEFYRKNNLDILNESCKKNKITRIKFQFNETRYTKENFPTKLYRFKYWVKSVEIRIVNELTNFSVDMRLFGGNITYGGYESGEDYIYKGGWLYPNSAISYFFQPVKDVAKLTYLIDDHR